MHVPSLVVCTIMYIHHNNVSSSSSIDLTNLTYIT